MGKSWRNYRDASRQNVGGDVEEGYRPCDDQIRTGALCRIADALEKIVACQERIAFHQTDLSKIRSQVYVLRADIRKLKKGE